MNVNKLISFFLCLLALSNLQAKHLVGGSITYELLQTFTNSKEYRITLELYRDCLPGNTDFDDASGVYVAAFRRDNKALAANIVMGNPVRSIMQVTSSDPCVDPPTGICYERAVYKGTVTLPNIAPGYYITWGRCCRNVTIANIIDPGSTGMALEAYIPNANINNNSPTFNKVAPTYICLGQDFRYDMGATDKDNDTLRYSLTTPLTEGNPDQPQPFATPPPHDPVFWQNPYNLSNIMGGSPSMSINPYTGELRARPGSLGQFVFSIIVSEYRNDELISETRRDVQINVINCNINFPPEIVLEPSVQVSNDTLLCYAGEENCFAFNLTDPNGEQLTATASGDLFAGGTVAPPYATFSANVGASPIVGNLCWVTDCNESGKVGQVKITLADSKNCRGVPDPNIVERTYLFKVLPGRATPPDVRCVSVTGTNQITVTWKNPAANKLRGFTGYILEKNDGSGWAAISTITDSLVNTYIDDMAFNADLNSYCYRLATAKVCPNPFVGVTGAEACSMTATATPVSSVQALIEWQPPYNVWSPSTYNVWSFNSLAPPKNEGLVIDSTKFLFLGCQYEGYVQIRMTDPLTGCEVYSGKTNQFQLIDLIPSNIDLCVATVTADDSGVELSWGKFIGDDFKYYRVYRAPKGSNDFTLIKELNNVEDTVYTDNTALVDELAYAYYIEKSDLCGNVQKTGKDYTMHISGNGADYQIYLQWNNYLGWEPAPSSTELWETNNGIPQRLVSTLGIGTTSFRDDNVVNSKAIYCYKVKAQRDATNTCYESWSNDVCITFEPTLYFPNAFSPNGDGKNDYFTPIGVFAKTFEMQIYNRWGILIYKTESQEQGWDGTVNGSPAPEGVYVFKARVVGFKDEEVQKTGTVTLIR